jgi:hypothetical protein
MDTDKRGRRRVPWRRDCGVVLLVMLVRLPGGIQLVFNG